MIAAACDARIESCPIDGTELLRTARVRLLRWTPADALSYLALDYQRENTGPRLDDAARTIDDALEAIRYFEWLEREVRGCGTWMVRELASDEFVGSVGLMPIDGEIEFGGRFLARFWGRHLGLHVGRCVLEHGFRRIGFERIATHHHPENRSATAVVRRLGFASCGSALHLGKPALRFVLERSDWMRRAANASGERAQLPER